MIGHVPPPYHLLSSSGFGAVVDQWQKREETLSHERWELMRMQACIGIQPHVKNKMTPQKLLSFPWEKKKPDRKATEPTVSKEEAKARFMKFANK